MDNQRSDEYEKVADQMSLDKALCKKRNSLHP